MFSSKCYSIWPYIQVLIHFEFIFVYHVTEFSNFTLLHVAVQFSQHHFWRDCLFSVYTLASFVVDKLTIGVWVIFWVFYPVPLSYISGFVPVPYCLITATLQYRLKLENPIQPAPFFCLRIALAHQGLSCFHINFKIGSFMFP